MRKLSQSIAVSGLALGLVVGAPLLEFSSVAQTISQSSTNEIDAAISEGTRLFQEGSSESLRKALVLFEQALQLSQTGKVSDKQALSLLALGRIYSALGEKQEALKYYNQALPLYRTVENRGGEAAILNNIGLVYDALGEKQEALKYYNQALPLYRTVENRGGEATTLTNIGSVYDALGEKQEALKYYNQALPLRRAVGDRNGEAATLNNIGSVYDALGEKQEALKYYNQALPFFRVVGDRGGEAATLNNIGLVYSALGEKQEALKYFNQALPLYRTVENRGGEATTLTNIGSVYSALGEKQEALKYYNQALPLRRAVGDRGGEAATLNNIGAVYSALGEKQEALKYYNQALPLRRAVGDRGGETVTLNNIGSVYSDLGEKQEALKYFNQALPFFRAVGDRSGEAATLNNIGSVYSDLGEKQEALKYFNQALPLYRTVGDQGGEAATLNNIGSVYSDLGEKQEALKYYNQALPLYRTVENRGGEAATLTNIGAVYSALGEKQEALKYYNQALPFFRVVGDRGGEAATLNNIGAVYSALGEKQEALKYYNQALPFRRAVGDRSGEAATLNNIGSVYSDLGEKQEALKYYNQALPFFRVVGDRNGEAATLNNVAVVLASQQQPELAIVFFKQSVSLYESLRQDLRQLPKEQQKSYTEKISDTYRGLANILLQQDRILEAQQVLDLLKVQELEDYLRNVRGNTAQLTILRPEEAILKQHNELQTRAIELSRELAQLRKKASETKLSAAEEKRLSDLDRLETALNAEFNAFRDKPEIKNFITQLTRAAQDQTIKLDDLEAIRNDLRRLNAVMLYPLILDDRLELIITTPDSPPLRRTVPLKRAELNAAVLEFRKALQDPTIDPKPIAQKLYSWLIKPLEADLKKTNPQSIIYAPDGQLRYIPLAALHDGTQWLAQRYQVNNITAKSLTKFNNPAQSKITILAGAFADEKANFPNPVDRKINYRGLPFAGREVTNLSQLFPNTTSFLDRAFSLSTFKPRMNGFTIVHLATHAAFIPGEPEKSFILFGDGSSATLRDIESWSLSNVDLVVLSACETGVGIKALGEKAFGNGEEILGLGYQFQNRGARATIASLWSVDDGGTQALMNAFYTALQSGKYTKVQALQQAQIALITQPQEQLTALKRGLGIAPDSSVSQLKQSLDHPYYWAPFILIGNGL